MYCFQYNDKRMQFLWNTLWFADNCNCWSTSSLLCSNMRRSPLESYEHIGRVFGSSASWAGGPGFRHVPIMDILTGRLWFSPVFQSKCRNITSKYLRLFIHLIIYLYYVSKIIIWSWIVKNVEGSIYSLCKHFPEETEGYYEQSGYSEAKDYTRHC
jgi:hypothetical protein